MFPLARSRVLPPFANGVTRSLKRGVSVCVERFFLTNKEEGMRKSMKMVLGVMVFVGLSCAASVYAEGVMGHEAGEEAAEVKGCKHCDKGGMGGEMMCNKAGRQVVATSDGGIVVVTNDSIVKYDKNLSVVKEVALGGAAAEPMHKAMMGKKGGGCPMMMKVGMMGGMKEAKEPAVVPAKK